MEPLTFSWIGTLEGRLQYGPFSLSPDQEPVGQRIPRGILGHFHFNGECVVIVFVCVCSKFAWCELILLWYYFTIAFVGNAKPFKLLDEQSAQNIYKK